MAGVAAKAIEDRAGLGILLMLAAYLLFSFIDTSVKWLVLAGLPATQLAFMRYLGNFLIPLVLIGREGISRDRFATRHPVLVIVRSLLLISASVLNFYALKFLALTVTSAIMFSAPIIVCLLSWPLLGDRVGPWRWFAIMLGFAGVLIVIRPFGEDFDAVAVLIVYNAFAFALYSILTRKLSGIVATDTMQFYMGAIGTLVLLPFAIVFWQNPGSVLNWTLMIGLGFWGWAGHELLTRAHGFAPAMTLMPYTYSFMLYLTLASWLVFGELPDFWVVVGAVIIVFSGLIIWLRERRRGAGAARAR